MAAGRPPKIRFCPLCGEQLTGRQWLAHKCAAAGKSEASPKDRDKADHASDTTVRELTYEPID